MATKTNRRWVAPGATPVDDKDGGLSKLVLQTALPLEPAAVPAGHARVRVAVTGVAYTDLLVIRGTYFRSFPWPRVPGYDWVGQVDELGPPAEGAAAATVDYAGVAAAAAAAAGAAGVATPLAVGDWVGAVTSVGGLQDYVTWPVADLIRVPREVADLGAAVAMLLNYTTAHMLLHQAAAPRFREGATVLVHSAAGGTGTALVELCRLAGAGRIFGTCSASKADAVRALGATPIATRARTLYTRCTRPPRAAAWT
jgi:NADPH:quinone reductase-like Zn-dependent oxidoreductase